MDVSFSGFLCKPIFNVSEIQSTDIWSRSLVGFLANLPRPYARMAVSVRCGNFLPRSPSDYTVPT
jgi:hypothetical protein